MTLRTPLLLVALLALALAACGDDSASEAADSGDADAAADGVVEVDVSLQDMEFVPDQVQAPAGSTVTFNLTNDGNLDHDLVFESGAESGVLASGESTSFEAGPFTETTVGWCDIPGHRAAGMELEVIVTD